MITNTDQLSTLLLEIGTEDIPARFIHLGMHQLKENTKSILKENSIRFSEVKTFGTPRRLVLIAEGIPQMQDDRSREALGPSRKIAFDESGSLTKAALGFARSQGIDASKLIIKNTDKGEYIAALIEGKGMRVFELLPEVLKNIVLSLRFPKSMRWSDNAMRFVRPIRWLTALLDSDTINFQIDGIKSSNTTRGHRFLSPGNFQIKDISDYTRLLSNNNVIVDPEERIKIISLKIDEIAGAESGTAVKDNALLETVCNIVEYPVPVLGEFSEDYLTLPKELLISVMKEHQKYFALEDSSKKLMNRFIVISNTSKANSDTVKIGAERVLKARFEDARFYFLEDSKKTLFSRVEDLKHVTFHEKLGSLYDKIQRIKNLSLYISKNAGDSDPSLIKNTERAAILSKTDLITGAVREFPELQGIMGRYYALNDNEDKAVAEALAEQYMPAYHGAALPQTKTGAILSLADKIDNIAVFFSLGMTPTGSEDPFALRRQTLGILTILLDQGYEITLRNLVSEAFKNMKKAGIKEISKIEMEVLNFFEQRVEPVFSAQGYPVNVINSVIPLFVDCTLQDFKKRLDSVQKFQASSESADFLTAIKRVKNIIPKTKLLEPKSKLFIEEPEKKLYEGFNKTKKTIEPILQQHEYFEALLAMSSLTELINNFFDNVLVMDKQKEIRVNRLSLLKNIWATAASIADLSQL